MIILKKSYIVNLEKCMIEDQIKKKKLVENLFERFQIVE